MKSRGSVGHRYVKHGAMIRLEYFVKWEKFPKEENSWEWKETLLKVEEKVWDFQEKHKLPPKHNKKKRNCCWDTNKLGGAGCKSRSQETI